MNMCLKNFEICLDSNFLRNYVFSVGIASGLIALFSTGTQ